MFRSLDNNSDVLSTFEPIETKASKNKQKTYRKRVSNKQTNNNEKHTQCIAVSSDDSFDYVMKGVKELDIEESHKVSTAVTIINIHWL